MSNPGPNLIVVMLCLLTAVRVSCKTKSELLRSKQTETRYTTPASTSSQSHRVKLFHNHRPIHLVSD